MRCAKDIAAGEFIGWFTGVVAVHSETSAENKFSVALDHYVHAGARIKNNPDDLRQVSSLQCARVCCHRLPAKDIIRTSTSTPTTLASYGIACIFSGGTRC